MDGVVREMNARVGSAAGDRWVEITKIFLYASNTTQDRDECTFSRAYVMQHLQ